MFKKFWKSLKWEDFWLTFVFLLLTIGVGGILIITFPAMLWILGILLGFGVLTLLVMFLYWWIVHREK